MKKKVYSYTWYMFWPPLLLDLLLLLCRRRRRRRRYCYCCCCCCCCCCCAVTRFCVRCKKTQNEKQSVVTGCAPGCIAGREAAAARQQQQQQQQKQRRRWRRRCSSSGQLPFVVSGWLLCFVSVAECCLLYTSPSPRDRQKSRMPSSA